MFEIRNLAKLGILLGLSISVMAGAMSLGRSASWDTLQSQKFKKWEATLNRNRSTGERFCAAETRGSGSTYMRLNFYLSKNGSFLEFYNSSWELIKGGATFTLAFSDGHSLRLRGNANGGGMWHDFTDRKNMQVILGLLVKNSSVRLINANGAPLAEFSLSGSTNALRAMSKCAGGI